LNAFDRPALILVVTFIAFTGSAWLGRKAAEQYRQTAQSEHENLNLVLGATLTLLGLIIGFTFSMALDRYDQRKAFEEAEANAISTAYLRADLLQAEDTAKIKALLRTYVELRMRFYVEGDRTQLAAVAARTGDLQRQLWDATTVAASPSPNPVTALALVGMNDLLNSQGYTQAAWWNRIPVAAWALMGLMGVCAMLLTGFTSTNVRGQRVVLGILPLVLAIAFYLIAEIESPRDGLIRIAPQNLQSLADSMRVPGSGPR